MLDFLQQFLATQIVRTIPVLSNSEQRVLSIASHLQQVTSGDLWILNGILQIQLGGGDEVD